MNKDIQLTDADQIAQFEICLVFFIIINQSKNFAFSKLNIVKQHLANEAWIAHFTGDDHVTPRAQCAPC
jgi:hypothetical protein